MATNVGKRISRQLADFLWGKGRTQNTGKCTSGGGSGIRTRDTVSRIHTFQACAFNHSATPPQSAFARPAGPPNLSAMRISA